jgi:hypothetical protein
VISCSSWEAWLRVGIHPKRQGPQAFAGIKKQGEPYNPRVGEEEGVLDRLFSDVIQVLPQFLGVVFGKYQRGIVSGSREIDL